VIKVRFSFHHSSMGTDVAVTAPVAEPAMAACPADSERRVRSIVDAELSFVWRALRRLGVPAADLSDAAQQVFTVAARRIGDIRLGAERAFLYQTAIRVASDARRMVVRRRETDDGALHNRPDHGLGPDEAFARAQARVLLDEVLAEMPVDLRAVFVLYELDEMTMAEIAVLVDAPPGTVASRLRRAREMFQSGVRRLHAREDKP
jgi:RNA polymerase sigma-70 factor (ECF subfamily)